VDDEVYGVPGGMGDYRMGVAATSTVDVYVQKSRVISDLALTANPDEDIALDAADMVAPSKPTSLTADYVGAGAVDLAWNPATDNTGVTAYHVYRWEEVSSVEFTPAHVRIATVTEPEFLDATTTPGATYRYEVRAVDAATNVGARSDWAEIYVNIPPVTEGEEYSLPRDTVLSVSAPGVLANDYNPDNAVALTAYVSSYAEHGIVAMDLDGGFTYTPDAGFVGTDDFSYIASDGVDESAPTQVSITVGPTMADGVIRVSGDNRYLTSVEASKKGFPYGAKTVVLATGENWPDALGGSALAGAVRGPLLLTKTAALTAEVLAEIGRLKADSVYILGSTAAVSADIENALKAELGAANVLRLGGANRYETAKKVADKTIELLGDDYTGNAFVATGLNFADAAAAAPLAAALGRPILLANINAGTVYVPGKTTEVDILGSPAAVPSSIETALNKLLGDADVERVGGINRYATAAMIAQLGVDEGMSWNGVGLATGLNFPDALSGGAMLSEFNSVLLLTRPDFLSGEAATKLSANKDSIDSLFIFGDTNAVSTVTEAAAKKAAGL
jgi:putative cell wall-binding protein